MVKLKLACEENEFIYSKLENLRKKLAMSHQDQKAANAKRILQAVEKFPLPIRTGKMAETLIQGVGPWWALEIDKWVEEMPKKRKASPVALAKRSSFLPDYCSAEWVIMMCLWQESSLSPYDINYTSKKHFSDCQSITNPSDVFEELEKKGILQQEDGIFSLTAYGVSIVPRLTQCPTVTEKNLIRFNPDDWIAEPKPERKTGNVSDFQIVLIVDTAERLSTDFSVILSRLSSRDLIVEKRKLWIGDYHWVCRVGFPKAQDYSLNYLVERKTADDLAHSIIDSRYEDQKIKIKLSEANCIYLLEGVVPKSSSKITSSTLITSLISTKFNYDFQIKITKDSSDTLNWLARMTHGLYQKVKNMTQADLESLNKFEHFQSMTNPNEGRTVSEVFGKQLRALDNVGEQNTLAILKKFPTPLSFYSVLKENRLKGERALDKFLKNIKMSNGYSIQKKTRSLLVNLFLG